MVDLVAFGLVWLWKDLRVFSNLNDSMILYWEFWLYKSLYFCVTSNVLIPFASLAFQHHVQSWYSPFLKSHPLRIPSEREKKQRRQKNLEDRSTFSRIWYIIPKFSVLIIFYCQKTLLKCSWHTAYFSPKASLRAVLQNSLEKFNCRHLSLSAYEQEAVRNKKTAV